MRQTETAQGAPDRHAMDSHLVRIGNFQHQIIQREVGLGRHPRRDPVPQTGQLAMPATITLSARLQPTCLAFQDHHFVDELHRNPKPRSGCAMRMPFLHKRDNPFTKCHRMWLAHLKPQYLPYRKGITDQASWESGGFCEVWARREARFDLIEAGLKEGADRVRRTMGIVEPIHAHQRRRETWIVAWRAMVEAGRRSSGQPMCSKPVPWPPETTMMEAEVDGTPELDKPCPGLPIGSACAYLQRRAPSWFGS